MFGIPYCGADICGYFNLPSENMCLRWMQMGAFYPFSRNHNGDFSGEQDPALWDNVAEASRRALTIRYWFLPYLYTLHYEAHREGSTVVRPLLAEFPTDLVARGVDDQFLWGSYLLISPVITETPLDSRRAHFPAARWYNYYTRGMEFEGPTTTDLFVPLFDIPVHIRGGGILPMQEPAANTMLRSVQV